MISMYTKQEIVIQSYREGKSQRMISRALDISRPTVKKYIEEYEQRVQQSGSAQEALSAYLSQPPAYKLVKRSKLKLTQEVQEIIDKYLEENRQKMQQGLRKQLLKSCDIFEQLTLQGIDIGYTTVCNYIRSKSVKQLSKEAFIRQEYLPGEVCEFDWGEVKLYINNELVRYQLAVFTSAYSNYRFAALYHRQDTLAFMESHVAFFDHTQGVYKQMVYDNMRVAVSKFVGKHEKEPTQALLQMRGHYQFSHRFCNAYKGNEKGHVERSVEYIRRKAFAVKSRFNSEQEADRWLTTTLTKLNNTKQKLSGKTANQLFSNEKKALLSAPTKLVCAEQVQLRVDKYATISYKTNRYSVPDYLVGQFVDVGILSHQIRIYHNNRIIASHKRSYKIHEWIIAIEHYLDTFKKKPGALSSSVALASSTYLKLLYNEHFKDEPRAFIELLAYCYKNKITEQSLEVSVTAILNAGGGQINSEKIKVLLGNKTSHFEPIACSQTTTLAQEQLAKVSALMN
ncbi:MAG: IS21 family transposase [Bacteroidales bacterium]|nr:IS21 family transposase [Bacteroidales bacterium]